MGPRSQSPACRPWPTRAARSSTCCSRRKRHWAPTSSPSPRWPTTPPAWRFPPIRPPTPRRCWLSLSAPPAPVVAPKVTASSAGGPSAGTLDRVRLTFSDPMNASTLPRAIRLLSPNGASISITSVQAVANTGGKVFDVLFSTQTTLGAYKLTVTPLAYDTAGLAISTYQATYTPALLAVTFGAACSRGGTESDSQQRRRSLSRNAGPGAPDLQRSHERFDAARRHSPGW